MILIFVDETSDSKQKDYLGLSCMGLKHNFYPIVKDEFHRILLNAGWDREIEFKGSYIFSSTKGATNVSVSDRVKIVESLIDLNVANSNARMRFAYSGVLSSAHRNDYLDRVPELIYNLLKNYGKPNGQGKNLVSISMDKREDVSPIELRQRILPRLSKLGFRLHEDVIAMVSNFETVGILFADIVGYLLGRIDTISSDIELFDNVSEVEMQANGKLRKLQTSQNLIGKIKTIQYVSLQALGPLPKLPAVASVN